MRRVLVVLLLLAVPGVLSAQASVVVPQKLTPEQTKLRDVLVALRDSLTRVNAATGRLQRDFRTTSAASLESRARTVEQACSAALPAVGPARAAVLQYQSAQLLDRARTALLDAAKGLTPALVRCQEQFGAMGQRGKGEEVRGYGNRRAEPLVEAVNRFDARLQDYFRAAGIQVRPAGAGPSPLAG